jgi:hypothetical protein
MSKSRQNIQFKAYAILTGGDVGASVSAEDAADLDGYIDSEVAELNADGTIYIDDPDNLADELFLTFCKLVANAAADEFAGVSDENKAAQLRNRLRVISRQTPGYGPQDSCYF